GRHLAAMLTQLGDRGPDSSGVAVYRNPAPSGSCKLTLHSADPEEDWTSLGEALQAMFGASTTPRVRASHATVVVEADATDVEAWLRSARPHVRVMSGGEVIEIFKGTGRPEEFAVRFGLSGIQGTHGLGHTRMATESLVTTEGSHPFSTGLDLCLVHNGSLSSHNRLP